MGVANPGETAPATPYFDPIFESALRQVIAAKAYRVASPAFTAFHPGNGVHRPFSHSSARSL